MAVPITYLYAMDTVAGTDPSKIDNEILPRLEKVIVDSILQEVFPERCASTAIGKRKRKRKLRIQRRLEVVGVSIYPPDYVTINCEWYFIHCYYTWFVAICIILLYLENYRFNSFHLVSLVFLPFIF